LAHTIANAAPEVRARSLPPERLDPAIIYLDELIYALTLSEE
jgi:hypothetical protein